MSSKNLLTRIALKNDTAANWAANATVVLLKGEIGIEIDTGKFKIGTGLLAWSALPYANVTPVEFANGDGDMKKSTYDTSNNGVVDNSEKLGGQLPGYYAQANHVHGNLTNDGKVGTAANKAIYTGTGGVIQAGTLPISAGGTGATTAAAILTNLGITATAAELNYIDGVTSAIQTQLNAKAPLSSPAFSGMPTAPTAAQGTSSTQLATTAFVIAEINKLLSGSNAMVFKGTLGTGGTVTALPEAHQVGDTYVVKTAGSYAGQVCEIGDMILCSETGTTANNAHWTIVQTNINGAVTGPASSVNGNVVVFDGTTGKLIKDSGLTLGKSVPSNAVFTDTDTKVRSTPSQTTKIYITGCDSAVDNTAEAKFDENVYIGNKPGELNAKTILLDNNNNESSKEALVDGDVVILDCGNSTF